MSCVRYSIVVNFSCCAGVNPSVPTLTPRQWSSASRSRWSGSVRSVSRPSTLRVLPLDVAFSVCMCGVYCTFIHSVISTSFPPMAFTSKGLRYTNAWPAVNIVDLEVGFMTRHIEGDVEQLTRTLAMLKPRLEVCERASVISASNPTPCIGFLWGLVPRASVAYGFCKQYTQYDSDRQQLHAVQ